MSKNLEWIFITVVGVLGWTNNPSKAQVKSNVYKTNRKILRLDLKFGITLTILTFFGNQINSNIRIAENRATTMPTSQLPCNLCRLRPTLYLTGLGRDQWALVLGPGL